MINIFICLVPVLISQLVSIEAGAYPRFFRKWPNNQVYFRFTVAYDEENFIIIRRAIKDLEKIVCVNITEVTDSNWRTPEDREPIEIVDADGCWSDIGDKNNGKKQELSLEINECETDSTTKHEFMHLLGLEHEHSRSDRDKYIRLHKSRIEDEEKSQFDRVDTINSGPFDFQSNMIYAPWQVSKIPGKPAWTVKTGQGKYDHPLDQGSISWQDAKTLNKIYKCGVNCKNICGRDAYLNKQCECVTPDKFAEEQCYDARDDCQSWLHECRTDDEIISECRKTCNICYKSPNGIGKRDTIEICEDWNEWEDAYCKKLSLKKQEEIDSDCKNEKVKFYCRKTCKSDCLYVEYPKILDECQDLIPSCKMSMQYCNTPFHKEKCAKTCGYCMFSMSSLLSLIKLKKKH